MKTQTNQQRLDAGEAAFFARELEIMKPQMFERAYPELKYAELIPVSADKDPAAEFVTYRMFDKQGIAKIVSNYADDLPRADVEAREFSAKVQTIGASAGWSFVELRAGLRTGRPLNQNKLAAAVESVKRHMDRLAFLGDSTVGMTGITNNANVPNTVVATVSATVTWAAKIALGTLAGIEGVLADLNAPFTRVAVATKGVEVIDTIALAPSSFAQIAQTRIPDTDSTILEFFLKAHPGVSVVTAHWLETSGTGSAKQMIAYRRSPDKLQLEIPEDVFVHPEEQRGLETLVNVTSRFAGVQVYFPLSMDYSYGM